MKKFEIKLINEDLIKQHSVNQILACNQYTKNHDLILTKQQALALIQTRTNALKETQRIELGDSVIDKLIDAFYDSPYISQENYEDTLHELIELFYDFKNNTWDILSDHELIYFMKTAFHETCYASLELLADEALRLSEHIHCGGNMASFLWKEEKE